MYLKSIEINGFKSFANKIVFEFPQGITGIVGPNGSGKSNIGDAVRWVLGEQSARQLRGSKMEDVIFSGTQSRRPMGFAYVAITFENANRIIPLDYEEVTVARRVYRSGESEYLINGSSCRRRDIVELFYDTGIGKEGYSIIGQGQVEKILSGKIEDSRELFDEAAGIAKYKKNRTVTEKSLEQERQNLERVTDILAELEKQVGPLEKQSAKAKEYLKLRDEEKDIDIHLFLYDYERLKKEQEENERQYKIVSGDLEDTRKIYEKIKEKNGKLQDQTQAVTESLETKESEKEELRQKKETKDNEILLLSHKVESNTLLITHYEELEKQSDEEKDTKTAEIEVLKKETVQKKQEISNGQKKLEELEESILTKRKEQEACEKKISGENDRLFSIMNTSSDTKEKLSRYAAMEEQLEIRNAEYNSRYISFNSELKEYNETAEELLKQQDAAKEAFEKQENLYQELEKREKHLQEKEQKYQDEMGNLNQEYLRTKSRYETLMNITERYDGYNQSIRRIMEQKNVNPGIIGVVADILALPEKYETAIEIALGGALQNIVTEDNETAKKMINFLKKNRFGRATFLPLTNIRRRNSTISPSVLQDEGVIGIASTLVKVEERFQALVDSLLGRTVVVDTVDHALSLSRKNNFSLRLVTLDGELLNPGGAITGGAFRHSGNLLGRKRETEECKDSLRKAKAAWEERKEDLSELKAGQQKLEEQKQQRKAKLDAASLLLHDLSNQIPDMDAKKEELSERITSLKEEHQILKEQIDEIRSQKEALLKEQEDNEQIHEQNNTVLDSLKEQLSEIRAEVSKLESEKNEQRISLSKMRQELDYLRSNKQRIEKEIENIKNSLEENKKEIKRLTEENISYEEEQKTLKAALQEITIQMDGISTNLEELKQQRSTAMKKQNQIFQELERENEKLLILEKEAAKLSSKQERMKEDFESKIDYMWETYEITYNQAFTLKHYEVKAEEAAEQRKQKKELQRQIKELGNININAIEEYKEVGERYEFLRGQYDDIKEAEAKLLTMIEELNTAMKEQFTKEFGNIQQMFTTVFQDLFEGGTASLELMDNENILECGIRIIAQPPGKKLQNIMLLSGGERALTAIALLFAIQNLKPSPFCLLDEIEAALDDANIVRFSKYLKKLSKDTQFIVITHRRGTMNAADALYGITMQEKGISTLISVDLIDKDLN